LKKKTEIYNEIYGKKWRLICIALVLVFSIISVSATGAENSTDSQASDRIVHESNIGVSNETENNCSYCIESNEENLEQNVGEIKSKEDQKTVTDNTGSETEESKGKDTQETVTNKTELKIEESKENQENTTEKAGSKTEESNENQKTVTDNTGSKTGESKSNEAQETVTDKTESKIGESKSNETQENVTDKTEPKIEESEDTQETITNKTEPKTEESKSNETQENVTGNTEPQTGTGKNTETQETVEDDTESQTNKDTDSQENIEESDSDSSESNVSNQELKVKTVNRTITQKSAGAKIESKTEVSNGSKSLKSAGAETETKIKTCNKTCNITKSMRNKVVKLEIKVFNLTTSLGSQEVKTKIKVYNWTDSQGNESAIPEIGAEENSWNNLQLILSYPYSLHSFYTANESLKLSYNGPEALGQQNVDIYLVKERSPSSPENEISYDMNESTINLEDVLNSNTKSYIQIPATLNKDGDLTPLKLGPLPAGNYCVLITLAGNETEKTESEKEILLAKHVEVLEYEMEAVAPYTVEEGENLKVNLTLKNAPTEKSYTYWAVLIKDDAYTVSEGQNPSGMITGIRPVVNGVDLIKSLETSLIGNESENGKDELKNKIQTMIGEDNGTISIGEKNQSNLSLKSLELSPGDYLLITGAYENKEGLAGMAQKELRITAKSSQGLGLESSLGNTFGSISSMKNRASQFMGIKSILETPKAFMFENIKQIFKQRN